jgi:acetolactate synthase-1/2/3 large subunit
MKKTVTEYIADFLVTKKLNTIFAVTGASAIRIIDSIGRRNELRYICPHHEQAGVMAAIGHYRKTGQVGVMVVTAGPGGANAITGVASAYLDSIPLIVLAGQ